MKMQNNKRAEKTCIFYMNFPKTEVVTFHLILQKDQ